MLVADQIRKSMLRSPRTRKTLFFAESGNLRSGEIEDEFEVAANGVPVLLKDQAWARQYSNESKKMIEEYTPARLKRSFIAELAAKDYKSRQSVDAFKRVFAGLTSDSVCLSPGGGPSREHPLLTTINIGLFPNVDLVADAHHLPYVDGVVDGVYCEAVFEHLHSPMAAAAEIFRVMKPGALAYICTPFIQAYHGYPHHYQNYTVTGHAHLFSQVGFEVLESGASVGPVFALTNMLYVFAIEYLPKPLNRLAAKLVAAFSILLRPIDKSLAAKPNGHVLASTTFVLLKKPL